MMNSVMSAAQKVIAFGAVLFVVSSQFLHASQPPPEGAPRDYETSVDSPYPKPPSLLDTDAQQSPTTALLTGGRFFHSSLDVEIPGLGRNSGNNLRFQRNYCNQDGFSDGVLGPGWATTLDVSLLDNGQGTYLFRDLDGFLFAFLKDSTGNYVYGQMKVVRLTDGTYQLTKSHGTRFVFGSNGRIQFIEDPNGHRLTYRYNGNLVSNLSDESGQGLQFTYNANSRLAQIRDPQGRTWFFTYDAAGNLNTVTDPLSRITSYFHDDPIDPQNITRIVGADGKKVDYEFDSSDRPIKQIGTDGGQTHLSFNEFLGTSTVTDVAGNAWNFEYILAGLTTVVIDPQKGLSQYVYQPDTKQMVSMTDGSNRTISFDYDTNQNLKQVSKPSGKKVTYTYDSAFHQWLTRTETGGRVITRTLDSHGNVLKILDSALGQTSFAYNSAGFITRQTDPDATITSFTYDSLGNLTSVEKSSGGSIQFGYDLLGRLTSKTTSEGVTRWSYDAGDRITQVILPNGTTRLFTYDGSVQAAYSYDARDLIASQIHFFEAFKLLGDWRSADDLNAGPGGVLHDSIRIGSSPTSVDPMGTYSIQVNYSTSVSRDIIVNLLDPVNGYLWYGGSRLRVPAGSGSVTVDVTVRNNPPPGTQYFWDALVVPVATDWTQTLAAARKLVTVRAGVVINPASPDSDKDGLTDADEINLHHTDPHSADTDGDGIPDGEEINETHTNPLVQDSLPATTEAQVNGADAVQLLGKWQVEGKGIFAVDRRGYLEYPISVSKPDIYRVEIDASAKVYLPQNAFDLLIYADGEFLGRMKLETQDKQSGVVHAYTPWLPAGAHRIGIFWDNETSFKSIKINSVKLQTLKGPDSNGNGIQDWVEARLQSQCGVDSPATSQISPACVEGRERFLSAMSISGGVQPQHGPGYAWYADIPLSASSPTLVDFSFQNGGRKERKSFTWKVTNLLKDNDLVIRKGDSLLFNAIPDGAISGTVSITAEGQSLSTTAQKPLIHKFDAAGTFTVTGKFTPATGSAITRSINVTVLAGAFESSREVDAWVGRKRAWICASLAQGAWVEADSRLGLEEVTSAPASDRSFEVTADEAWEPRCVVARTGEHGSILGNAKILGYRLYFSDQTGVKILQTYPDGSSLYEETFVLSPVAPNITVSLNIFVAGVAFEDGTISRQLTALDFNALGECKVRYVKPASAKTSICHTVKTYQGTIFSGND